MNEEALKSNFAKRTEELVKKYQELSKKKQQLIGVLQQIDEELLRTEGQLNARKEMEKELGVGTEAPAKPVENSAPKVENPETPTV